MPALSECVLLLYVGSIFIASLDSVTSLETSSGANAKNGGNFNNAGQTVGSKITSVGSGDVINRNEDTVSSLLKTRDPDSFSTTDSFGNVNNFNNAGQIVGTRISSVGPGDVINMDEDTVNSLLTTRDPDSFSTTDSFGNVNNFNNAGQIVGTRISSVGPGDVINMDDKVGGDDFTTGVNLPSLSRGAKYTRFHKGKVFAQVIGPRRMSIEIVGKAVIVNNKVLCPDVRHLGRKKMYQIQGDGSMWYTNLRLGREMTPEEETHFKNELSTVGAAKSAGAVVNTEAGGPRRRRTSRQRSRGQQ